MKIREEICRQIMCRNIYACRETTKKHCEECGKKIIPTPTVHMHENLCANCSRKYK